MKATIIDTHHTIEIENVQIDLFYNFDRSQMQVFIDGNHFVTANFNPARQVLSYTNILQVSVTYYEHYVKYLNQKEQLKQNP